MKNDRITMSVIGFNYDSLNEHDITVELSSVRDSDDVPSVEVSYPQCDYRFLWSRDENEAGDMITELNLVQVYVRDTHPVALPHATVQFETLIRAYITDALSSMNFASKTVTVL